MSGLETTASKHFNITKAYALQAVYDKEYKFPSWTVSAVRDSIWQPLLRKTCVYYDSDDKLEVVKRVVREREPCNQAGERKFDEDKLEALLGWRECFYNRCFKKNG